MAGEDTTVHALAFGRAGQAPSLLSVPDPRFRDDQYKLLERLSDTLEEYFAERRARGSYPQLVVSCAAGVTLLDVLSERLRSQRDDHKLRRLGELLGYAAGRYPIAGQQILLSATAALRLHFATGQQAGEDEHLGALLTWISPPKEESFWEALTRAEEEPMGVKTDPAFDNKVLTPMVMAYNRGRRDGASSSLQAVRAGQIHEALAPVVTRIYENTQKALSLLREELPSPLPALAALEKREAEELQSFMRSREAGYFLSLRDRPRPAVFRLEAREDALEQLEAARLYGDQIARAEAVLSGSVLVGVVQNPRELKHSPRQKELRFEVLSRQAGLRLRRRDELCLLSDPRLRVVVTDIQRQGTESRVFVRVLRGMRAVGLLAEGQPVELGPSGPDWSSLPRLRGKLKIRLSQNNWTHDREGKIPLPIKSRQKHPEDPLAAVEALRQRERGVK